VALCFLAPILWAGEAVFIPAGTRIPFFAGSSESKPFKRDSVPVKAFWMDRYPVTKGEFAQFVQARPEWRKSQVKSLYADSHYLDDWKDDLHFGNQASDAQTPVTHVSWFSARAYCQTRGKDLPTTDQWEYVAYDRGRGPSQKLEWFGQPNPPRLPRVTSAFTNGFGVSGLYGLIWEWTLDFSSAIPTDEDGNDQFCGAGSSGAADSSDYASFLRYAFRSSLKASYTTENLGFRCVQETHP
jgi:formylglycine-generating enzyme required for sulfatase activity